MYSLKNDLLLLGKSRQRVDPWRQLLRSKHMDPIQGKFVTLLRAMQSLQPSENRDDLQDWKRVRAEITDF